MSDKSNIEWTDASWNPVTGCSKVSPGCANCYAEAVTQRYAGRPGWPAEFQPWTPANAAENVVLHPERLEAPLRWRKPRRVFVNSMSDLFHENVPIDFIARVFVVMMLTPKHTYQILTKRPDRMLSVLNDAEFKAHVNVKMFTAGIVIDRSLYRWPLDNVWLGCSVENQHWADVRIPLLLQTPAAVRFLSVEPMLGPVDLRGLALPMVTASFEGNDTLYPDPDRAIDWVIVGGESGRGHRPLDLAWVESLRDQCAAAGIAYFGKQAGGARPGIPLPGRLGDQEFPK